MSDFNQQLTESIPRLRRYARALLHDLHFADDLVQDCLERAWTRQHLYNVSLAILPWLFSIMHNIYVNSVRDYQRAPPMSSLQEQDEASITQHDSELSLRDLDRCLRLLSNEHREIILLVGLEQLSYQETAQVLNVPVGTVMSRLMRAREKLKLLMTNQPVTHIRRVK